jgi:hypothetical protein
MCSAMASGSSIGSGVRTGSGAWPRTTTVPASSSRRASEALRVRPGHHPAQHPALAVDADEAQRHLAQPGHQLLTPVAGLAVHRGAVRAELVGELPADLLPQPPGARRGVGVHGDLPVRGDHVHRPYRPGRVHLHLKLRAVRHRHPHRPEVEARHIVLRRLGLVVGPEIRDERTLDMVVVVQLVLDDLRLLGSTTTPPSEQSHLA